MESEQPNKKEVFNLENKALARTRQRLLKNKKHAEKMHISG